MVDDSGQVFLLVTIGNVADGIKSLSLIRSDFLPTVLRMAKAPTETVDLLLTRLAPNENYDAIAERAGISTRSLWAMRTGRHGRTNRSTIAALAVALKVDAARVLAAVEASRAAAEP